MRLKNLLLLVLAAAALLVVIGWTAQGRGPSRLAWEYQIERVLVSQESERLNELGAQGWELVGVPAGDSVETRDGREYHYRYYYLKRQK